VLETRLAPVLFALGFVDLLAVAGLIHRAHQPFVTDHELRLMEWVLAGLWPVIAAEATLAFVRRGPAVSPWRAAGRVLLVLAFPAMRMGWVHPRTNMIWLPGLGWQPPGKQLLKVLDRKFGGPMLLFAFLILPVLGMQYLPPEHVRDLPGYSLALSVSVSVIWVAFALEFILKVSASPRSLVYAKERWLDAAIVLLPTLEFALTNWVNAAPLARLLRIGRALDPTQLRTMNEAYRFRGVLMKGWQAFLMLEGVARLTGNSPAKRLRKVEGQIAELEEELAELRAHADELRKLCGANPERERRGDANPVAHAPGSPVSPPP
jgi:hypothetical protein